MNRRTFLVRGLMGGGIAAGSLLVIPGPGVAAPRTGLVVHDSPRPVMALDVRDKEGNAAGLGALIGQAVVLNLWASWCQPCVTELPSLDRLVPLVAPDGVIVVALCLDRSGAIGAAKTYTRLGIKNLAIFVDHDRKAGEVFDAPALPTTLLINRAGAEVARMIGPAEWDGDAGLRLAKALAKGGTLPRDFG